jgi:hypothetical protein
MNWGKEIEAQLGNYSNSQYTHTLPCGCPDPWTHDNGMPCVLNQPMGICIPPEGIHLSCPAHPAGHHIYGQNVRC